jgi:hypothetical protein
MAAELVAGTSQLGFISSNTQSAEESCTGIARYLFQLTAQSRTALVLGNIGDWYPCGNHAESRIEHGEFPQKRLKRGFA